MRKSFCDAAAAARSLGRAASMRCWSALRSRSSAVKRLLVPSNGSLTSRGVSMSTILPFKSAASSCSAVIAATLTTSADTRPSKPGDQTLGYASTGHGLSPVTAIATWSQRQPRPNGPQASVRAFCRPKVPNALVAHAWALRRLGEPVTRGP